VCESVCMREREGEREGVWEGEGESVCVSGFRVQGARGASHLGVVFSLGVKSAHSVSLRDLPLGAPSPVAETLVPLLCPKPQPFNLKP